MNVNEWDGWVEREMENEKFEKTERESEWEIDKERCVLASFFFHERAGFRSDMLIL